MNSSRQRFISKEMIEQVLAATDDLEWRVIIALSRFGGLRCPSEHLCLQWRDIDWEAGSMLVRCPKLAHIEHCATRKVPLFPEVYAQVLPLFEQTPSGTQYVINRYREPNTNLGTQFKRIIKRSKLEPWPRLFQNLRASRETELMRQYDLTTVCKWIGNSPAIAARHYAMSQDLDSDLLRAAGRNKPAKAQQKAQQPAQENDDQGLTAIPGENQKKLENAGKMHSRQEMSSSDKTIQWAVQDLNL